MKAITQARKKAKLSQRLLAELSGVAYKTLQLIEQDSDARLSTLSKLAQGLGYSKKHFNTHIEQFFLEPKDSLYLCSQKIVEDKDWKIHLFNFVDAFRKNPSLDLIKHPPTEKLKPQLRALLASTVETLCLDFGFKNPPWSLSIAALKEPHFVADIENLKAMALVESPLTFRKRNLFVLANFMERA